MLDKYPHPEDWHRVHFSDEVHFGYGTQDKLRIIWKAGMRYCQDCIEEVQEPTEKRQKNIYRCWAAVGHNLKSDIYFYELPGTYIDEILEPIVNPWLQVTTILCWKKMEIRGLDREKPNTVRTWKERNGLESYFNCHNSPNH